MSESYDVTVHFDDLNIAKRAAELLSLTFPMLQFELSAVPEVDLSINTQGYLNYVRTTYCNTCVHRKEDVLSMNCPCRECKFFNIFLDKDNYEAEK